MCSLVFSSAAKAVAAVSEKILLPPSYCSRFFGKCKAQYMTFLFAPRVLSSCPVRAALPPVGTDAKKEKARPILIHGLCLFEIYSEKELPPRPSDSATGKTAAGADRLRGAFPGRLHPPQIGQRTGKRSETILPPFILYGDIPVVSRTAQNGNALRYGNIAFADDASL